MPAAFETHEWDALQDLVLDVFMLITRASPGTPDANLRVFSGLLSKPEVLGNPLFASVLATITETKIAAYGRKFADLEKKRKGKLDYFAHFRREISAIAVLIDKRLPPPDASAFKRTLTTFGGLIAAASGSGNDPGVDAVELKALAAIREWLGLH